MAVAPAEPKPLDFLREVAAAFCVDSETTMAAISPTAAACGIGSAENAVIAEVQLASGETCSHFDVLIENSTGEWEVADNTTSAGSTPTNEGNIGIAITAAEAAGKAFVLRAGELKMDTAIVTNGEIYVLGASGAINPIGDLGSGDYVTIIGVGVDGGANADSIIVDFNATGYAKP